MNYKHPKLKRPSSEELNEVIALIPACIKGIPQAQTRFYNIFKSSMYKLCLHYTNGNRTTAQDLVQEGFIRTFMYLPSLRDYRVVFSWVCDVFASLSLSFIKQTQRNKYKPVFNIVEINEDLDFMPTDDFDNAYDQDVLISLCKQSHQSIFRLVIAGYNYPEISERFTMPVGTLKSIVSRCRARMREEYLI